MLYRVLVFLTVTTVCLAAVYIQPLEEKPEEYKDYDGCWVSEIQQFIPIGETVPSPAECKGFQCTDTYVYVYTCGVVYVEPPCYATMNKSLPYPGCCQPEVVCP